MNITDFRVSVVITSYNEKHYLKEAIESIINQTLRPHEIIIADDASTDGSRELIKNYIARYNDWVRGVFQKDNVGIPKNRNAALRLVTGDYVIILDGDDKYLPRNIELQVKALIEHPEAGCVYTNYYFVDAWGVKTQIRDTVIQPSGNLLVYIARGKMGLMRSMMIRYDLVKKIGFFEERFPKYDGFILTLRLAKLSEFIYIFSPLAEKRDHKKGASKSFSARENFHYREDVCKEVLNFTSDLSPQKIKQINDEWFWDLAISRILAEIEEGKRTKALFYIFRIFIRRPKHIVRILKLIKMFCNECCR